MIDDLAQRVRDYPEIYLEGRFTMPCCHGMYGGAFLVDLSDAGEGVKEALYRAFLQSVDETVKSHVCS